MTGFDFAILDWIQANMRCEALDVFFVYATSLGKWGMIWLVIAAVLVITKKYRKCGITMYVSLLFGLLISNVILKNIVARPRPFQLNPSVELIVALPGDFSFPSGHTTACFAAAAVMMHYDKRIGIPALILASVIAFSRLYLYVHFPTDVIAGILIGIGCAFAAIKLADVLEKKKIIPPPGG